MIRNLKVKKTVKLSKVCNVKFFMEPSNKELNETGTVSCKNNVVDVDQKIENISTLLKTNKEVSSLLQVKTMLMRKELNHWNHALGACLRL